MTFRSRFLLASIAFVLALGLAEWAIRAVGRTSLDGEFWIGSALLRPYQLPKRSLSRTLEKYTSAKPHRVVYDADLGWAPTPHGETDSGKYKYDGSGIRGIVEYSPQPAPQVTRIALFGDSFTHGDDVSFPDTFGNLLEKQLLATGLKSEVLNFGVSAYGMDQAYLRWAKSGASFNPAVVIFGFQPENVKRNLNLLRYFYTHSEDEIPFTKPRFIAEQNSLKLVNSPTVPLPELPKLAQTFDSWELSRFEFFYHPSDFQNDVWFSSRVFGLIWSFATTSNKYVYERQERFFYDLQEAPAQLALLILHRFKAEVESSGARFLVVYLPRLRHLAFTQKGEALPYDSLLSEIKNKFDVVDPRQNLLRRETQLSKLYAGDVHFSRAGNEAVAEALYERLAPERRAP